MIDIHSHILPAIDDGCQSLEETINMAKLAVDEGITKMIATPHHQNGYFLNRKKDIVKYVEQLNDALLKEKVPLEILPGQETRIYGDFIQDLENGEILPLNHSNYLFIELPSGHVPRYTEKMLFDIQLKGITPIIVHPERNKEIRENPDILSNLINKGSLSQVTAGSITGHFGKRIQKFTMQLIEANLVHFVASDVHNITTRTFHMRDAFLIVEKEFGNQAVYFFQENAELLVDGQTVFKPEPGTVKRKKFLGLF